MSKRFFKNRIMLFAALLLLTVISAAGALSAVTSSLSLEQRARCGLEEHVHTEECYVGDVLVCGKKMHTHSENCYLVLLSDNDINRLLIQVDRTADKSLESVIQNTVLGALTLNRQDGAAAESGNASDEESGAASDEETSSLPVDSLSAGITDTGQTDASESMTGEEIAQINEVVAANDIQPSAVLNENLTVQTGTGRQTEASLLSALLNGGNSILSAGGGSSTYEIITPGNTTNTVYFFIRLDSTNVCIGSDTLSGTNRKRISCDTVVSVYNTSPIITALTSANQIASSYYIRYNTNQNSTTFGTNARKNGNNLAFGTGTNARYAILSSTSNVTTPVDFYTVTLDYSGVDPDKANQEQYVESGLSSTLALDSEYDWYTAETGGTKMEASTWASYAIDDTITLYARPRNYTVTYLTAGGAEYQSFSLSPGVSHNVIAPLTGYNAWLDNNNVIRSEGDSFSVNANVTLTPVLAHTVTYNGTGIPDIKVLDGADYTVTEDPGDGYLWVGSDGQYYLNGDTISGITKDITLTKAAYHTVTYQYVDGTVLETVRVIDGGSHDVRTVEDGYAWFRGATLLTASTITSVTEDITITAKKIYTVYMVDENSVYSEYTVYEGDLFVLPDLPSGYLWTDGTNTYPAGTSVTITTDMGFSPVQGEPMTVNYTLNWSVPSGLTAPSSSATSPASTSAPTLVGNTSDSATAGDNYTVNTVSDRTVVCTFTSQSNRYGAVYFTGWLTETGELIQPGVQLTWDELKIYDDDDDGKVDLIGQWDYHQLQSVDFFVKYNSDNDGSTGPTYFTDVVFATYVGGIDGSSSTVNSLNNAYAIELASGSTDYLSNDKLVRALYGASSGPWLAEFPSDEYIFEQLKSDASSGKLSVPNDDGEYVTVDVNDLNEYGYAIRWYSFKAIGDGGVSDWHIDGVLVRKVGKVHTTKTFAGNPTLISAAKDGFYITAVNEDASKHIIMTIVAADSTEQSRILAELGWDASIVTKWITPIDDGDGNANTYLWEFDDIKYNEQWTITEHPPDLSEIATYDEWIVVDSSALGQSDAGVGGIVSVKGVTQATDLEDVEWLRAEFNNIYYKSNSLMLKKEDGSTGQVLSGVEFEFWQGGNLITFNYNSEKGIYERASGSSGAFKALPIGDGYANISLEGFSYEAGDIIIREVSPPEGYDPVGDVAVGYTVDTNGDGIKDSTIGITNGATYAQYHDGLVIIQNNPTLQDVTVKKTWNCDESEKGDVVLQLLANGDVTLTARILAGRKDSDGKPIAATVTLTESGGWTYTWKDMPLYANGVKVDYTVRELKIADESCKSDYSFANWLVNYKSAVTDANGNITLGVENITPSRPMLYLNKTDMLGRPLAGAVFELVEVDEYGNPVTDAVVKTATSGEDGSLFFDNLRYDTRYRLRELSAPDGYWTYTEPAYLVIEVGGTVKVGTVLTTTEDDIATVSGSHDYVSTGGSTFTTTVTNRSADKLPETGGHGRIGYYATGVMLMLLALCVAILPRIKKKGRYRMRR